MDLIFQRSGAGELVGQPRSSDVFQVYPHSRLERYGHEREEVSETSTPGKLVSTHPRDVPFILPSWEPWPSLISFTHLFEELKGLGKGAVVVFQGLQITLRTFLRSGGKREMVEERWAFWEHPNLLGQKP